MYSLCKIHSLCEDRMNKPESGENVSDAIRREQRVAQFDHGAHGFKQVRHLCFMVAALSDGFATATRFR